MLHYNDKYKYNIQYPQMEDYPNAELYNEAVEEYTNAVAEIERFSIGKKILIQDGVKFVSELQRVLHKDRVIRWVEFEKRKPENSCWCWVDRDGMVSVAYWNDERKEWDELLPFISEPERWQVIQPPIV